MKAKSILMMCCLFLLIGVESICQAQELEGKFRIRWRLNNIPDSVRGVIYVFSPTMTPGKAIVEFHIRRYHFTTKAFKVFRLGKKLSQLDLRPVGGSRRMD